MIRGLYTAYTGMRNEQQRLDIVSNNIANASTVGYKSESVSNQSFDDSLAIKIKDSSVGFKDEEIGKMNLGVKIGEVYTDYTQGSLRQTGSTFDFAIEGKGFFQVSVTDNNGDTSTKYTRAGTFTMDKDGYIVDSSGNHLLGEDGEFLKVNPQAAEITSGLDGSIYADGEYCGKIDLIDFEDYDYISKYGDNMYETVNGATEVETSSAIRQGYTEQSNVETVSEMVDLITITRAYETNQKIISTLDSMTDKAVNEVAKV